jgi:AraC-like DNA-binding protein
MAYLLAWRMALAKQMLRRREAPIAEVAERVGYSSVSTFGVAFTRHVGMPPGRYAKGGGDDEAAPEPESVGAAG